MEGGEQNRGNVCVPKDLMNTLTKRSHENEEREAVEEIELSLGLSMNGKFGVDPTRKKLRRSSSVSNVVVNDGSVGNGSGPQACGVASEGDALLVRASSMPSETRELCRREEFQPARSMEKLKSVRVLKEMGKCSKDVDGNGLHADANGISDLHSQLIRESTRNPMTQGSSSHQFPQELVVEGQAVVICADPPTDEESLRSALVDMPYVSTRGYGPNHNKIEGFLYRYNMGEEVKIVCVCHGMFLSPAEFVKHGGGGDVACPLKHIVVNSFPLY